MSTRFIPHSRAGNSEVNGWMWPEFKLVRDCMAVLVNEDRHKISEELALELLTLKKIRSNMKVLSCPPHFSGAQGQVTLKSKWMEVDGIQHSPRFYDYPGYQ